MNKLLSLSLMFSLAPLLITAKDKRELRSSSPNVILIVTDDQGIGDLGCHGNPWLQTPNIDKFYQESVRMTNFHVSPLSTPTRSSIITGRYPIRNGAWATFKGRDVISRSVPTVAEIFQKNGYSTAMFGKWHLGDNYPSRPTDCGFDFVVQHSSGGVGELSDYWGNNYFDDVYLVNNKPIQFKGYCTDVWFDQAVNYIKTSTEDKPFFVYLATNAPHAPWVVDEKYSNPYKDLAGVEYPSAEFYGMLTNIDENFGKLDEFLKKEGLDKNTIVIYMTDNGTSAGFSGKLGYNQGYRGKKSSKYEGGHRVPFFIRLPQGYSDIGGRDIDALTAHIDIIPTLSALCDFKIDSKKYDGIDFSNLLLDENAKAEDREVFIHHRQDYKPPFDLEESCIMRNKWRLVDGKELYNVDEDRAQQRDLSKKHKDIVEDLIKVNEEFIRETKKCPEYYSFNYPIIGNENQNVVVLTIQHAVGEGKGIWKAEHVAAGMKNENSKHPIEFEKAGKYKISCMRWPKECSGPIKGVPLENPKGRFTYKAISPEKVEIKIGDKVYTKDVSEIDAEISFDVDVEKGREILEANFIEDGERYGIYYIYVKKL